MGNTIDQKNNKFNILVITRNCWDNSNNTGNTMSNFFCDFEEVGIHNLYFRGCQGSNQICHSSYSISEIELVRHLFDKTDIGKLSIINQSQLADGSRNIKEKKAYNIAKKIHLISLHFLEECIWRVSNWDNRLLENYIKAINPIVIFMPVFDCWYPFRVLKKVQRISNAKVVLFHADDNYSLKRRSVNPLFWIYRFVLREYIYAAEKDATLSFCISELQKDEYECYFNKEMYLLRKSGNFSVCPPKEVNSNKIIATYAGNISVGRWKTLLKVGRAFDALSQYNVTVEMRIFTFDHISNWLKRKFEKIHCVKLMGGIQNSEIHKVYSQSNILIYVESFSKRDIMDVRLSFSTKIIDYLMSNRAILAVGPANISSMSFFIKNDCAITATKECEIAKKCYEVATKQEIRDAYSGKAWKCGQKNHNFQKENQRFKELIYSLFEKNEQD